MGLSINPLEFYKYLRERSEQDRKAVIEWIDSVREDARRLSAFWEKISEDLENQEMTRFNRAELKAGGYFIGQANVGIRLAHFYQSATVASGGRLDRRLWDGFVSQLSKTLNQKRITRELGEKLLLRLKDEQPFLLDEDGRTTNIRTVQDAARLLQNELAALDVLIATIKASPKIFR